MISAEDGPFDLIVKWRKFLGDAILGKMMDCFYCLSIWIAVPFGIWLGRNVAEKIIMWIALSGAACLLEQATTNKNAPGKVAYHEED